MSSIMHSSEDLRLWKCFVSSVIITSCREQQNSKQPLSASPDASATLSKRANGSKYAKSAHLSVTWSVDEKLVTEVKIQNGRVPKAGTVLPRVTVALDTMTSLTWIIGDDTHGQQAGKGRNVHKHYQLEYVHSLFFNQFLICFVFVDTVVLPR